MRKLLLLLLIPLSLYSQNTIGFPDVINYSKASYSAGLQNWDIKQDRNGVIYVANNEGLLSFDGRYWKLYPLPNKTIVRSLEIGPDSRIYVGGQDEMGYFLPDAGGRLQYHSLVRQIPAKDRSFGDVWDIIALKKDVFFRSSNKIFRLTDETIASFNAPLEWAFMGQCRGQLYAQDYKAGLLQFIANTWKPLGIHSQLPANDPITAILPVGSDSALITTLKNGIFYLSNSGISGLNAASNQVFKNDRIYSAVTINTDWVGLATNSSGIYIIDHKGNIIQGFSRKEQIQNNNVLSLFLDNQGNLWLGLDNGIDFITYNSAIKHISPLMGEGSGYTVMIHDRNLYMGTSNGLYQVPLQPVKDLSFSKGNFSLVEGTKGQTWSLGEINDQLLLGHHEGAFLVSGNRAVPISHKPGFWNFIPLSSTYPSAQIVAGHYKGLQFFDYKGGSFIPANDLPWFTESSRFVALDQDDNIWVSHPYHGVFRISKKTDGTYTEHIYTDKDGLPSLLNNHAYKIKNSVLVATEKGIYQYNTQKDAFEPSPYYQKILGNQSLRYLKEDAGGNLWFIHEKNLGVVDLSGEKPNIIYLPELNNKMLSGFECIYPVDEANVFLGGEKGFYHINLAKYKKTIPELRVQVRTVRISGKNDSLLFGGYFHNVNDRQEQDKKDIPDLSYSWKTLHFEFASSLFGYQANLEYSYRLDGFEENWSEWTRRTEKEYTNLPAGNYRFEVKVRNNLGNESPVSGYAFTILPPWYLSTIAKLVYLLILVAIIYGVYRWQHKKFRLQHKKFEEEQQKLLYIHELERNKTESELVSLRNQKLESDIHFKNSELASSAMHLVKKGELLTKVKGELTQVMKRLDNEQAISELKKMIKTLSEDDQVDKEWENFAKHFDKVHSDFVVKLKEKHPAITGNEMKLSAYLRMNLSTKEIAQLMNISVRGVEISRYRLRKKLGIPTEVNLFEYLMNLNGEDNSKIKSQK
jgi:ligand-binding sensor domain-containing protein/DNA-binding CsgD family transcriptional regulator